jgi:hypothetical protein
MLITIDKSSLSPFLAPLIKKYSELCELCASVVNSPEEPKVKITVSDFGRKR